MNKDLNNQTIKQYLLGVLPSAETESFDELVFTGSKFEDALKSTENDLVDAYVSGKLSGADLENFNSYYLASPLRRQKVEFAGAFQDFAAKNLKETTLGEEIKTRQKSAGLLSIFSFYRNLWQFGFAAALVLLIFGIGWLWLENNRLRENTNEMQAKCDELLKRESELEQRENQLQNELSNRNSTDAETEKEFARVREERESLQQKLKAEQMRKEPMAAAQKKLPEPLHDPKQPPTAISKLSIASFVLLAPLRGNNQLATVSIPPKTEYLAMQLQIESDEYPFYRVALVDQSSGQTVWQSGKLKAAKKSLTVRLPAKLVKSQIHSLEVSGIKATGEAESFSSYLFEAVPQ